MQGQYVNFIKDLIKAIKTMKNRWVGEPERVCTELLMNEIKKLIKKV